MHGCNTNAAGYNTWQGYLLLQSNTKGTKEEENTNRIPAENFHHIILVVLFWMRGRGVACPSTRLVQKPWGDPQEASVTSAESL